MTVTPPPTGAPAEQDAPPAAGSGAPARITQRRIAELAGVSQATVSLVLNGKADASSRIPEETRRRVQQVIEDTVYAADPAARRLAGPGNSIIGVFTYEPAFPSASQEFYTSLLTGIEAEAENLGLDLLMFTSAPVREGRRRLFHENNRLRLADGCLLLGREMDPEDLARLVASGFPFVAIGRRTVPGVPYVAVDYAAGTAELVRRAAQLGHRRFHYLQPEASGESREDRRRGFGEGLAGTGLDVGAPRTTVDPERLEEAWRAVKAAGSTVLFVEERDHALALRHHAERDGLSVPSDLSIVVLADLSRAPEIGRPADGGAVFTRLNPPRARLGATATALLAKLLAPGTDLAEDERRITLDCPIHPGETLAPVRGDDVPDARLTLEGDPQ